MILVPTKQTRAIARRMAVEAEDHGADVVRYVRDIERSQIPALIGLLAQLAAGHPMILDHAQTTINTDPKWLCRQAAADAAHFYGIDYDEMMALRKDPHLYRGRCVAMTAARMIGISLPTIGKHFGQHHTTVMHAERRCERDPDMLRVATSIASRLVAPAEEVA